jgi:hypothetical protein
MTGFDDTTRGEVGVQAPLPIDNRHKYQAYLYFLAYQNAVTPGAIPVYSPDQRDRVAGAGGGEPDEEFRDSSGQFI